MGGGSVQPGTGEFNFAVTEGYYVEDGKIQHPVKAATLISTGPAVLKKFRWWAVTSLWHAECAGQFPEPFLLR